MKYIASLIVTQCMVSLTVGQEVILQHCVILELETKDSIDLQKASFTLPFLAKRAGSKEKSRKGTLVLRSISS